VLYGLPQAVDTILKGDRAVLVEGYFDVLSLHQAGLTGAVAASGTAFTDQQAQILKRLVKRVVLVFDADDAGMKAAWRSYTSLVRERLDVTFVPMPAGEDPDTLVRSEGPERFRSRLQRAEDVVEFYLGRLTPPIAGRPPGERAEAVRGLLELLAADADRLRQAMNLEQLAGAIGLETGLLQREMEQLAQQSAPPPIPRADERRRIEPLTGLEAGLLAALLRKGPDLERLIEKLSPDDFNDPRARTLFLEMTSLWETGGVLDTGRLMERLDAEGRGMLAALLTREDPPGEESGEELLKAVEGRRLKVQRRQLRESIEQARRAGDEQTLARLLKEYQEMRH
jgi:DNA primase